MFVLCAVNLSSYLCFNSSRNSSSGLRIHPEHQSGDTYRWIHSVEMDIMINLLSHHSFCFSPNFHLFYFSNIYFIWGWFDCFYLRIYCTTSFPLTKILYGNLLLLFTLRCEAPHSDYLFCHQVYSVNQILLGNLSFLWHFLDFYNETVC